MTTIQQLPTSYSSNNSVYNSVPYDSGSKVSYDSGSNSGPAWKKLSNGEEVRQIKDPITGGYTDEVRNSETGKMEELFDYNSSGQKTGVTVWNWNSDGTLKSTDQYKIDSNGQTTKTTTSNGQASSPLSVNLPTFQDPLNQSA